MKRIKLLIKIKRIVSPLINCLSCVVSFFEIPVFLFKNRRIFSNDIVYVVYHWSFGHTFLALDYASRLYYPNRISLIHLTPTYRTNKYLPNCFRHSIDEFSFRSFIDLSQNAINYRIIRFCCLFLSGLTNKFQVIDHLNMYKMLSLANEGILSGSEKMNKLEKYNEWTGYHRLLSNKIGMNPSLPIALFKQCNKQIEKRYPDFFSRPFVTLLLRKRRSNNFYDKARCSGPQENYIPAVRWLTENGYHVVGTGETEHEYFSGIPGYYSMESVNLSYDQMNLFVLMHSSLYIGQHSGAYLLPNSCGIPVLLTDSFPYWRGTCCCNDIVLCKHLYMMESGEKTEVSPVEIYRDHTDLAYGLNYIDKGVKIEPNSPEELLEATKESILRVEGKLLYTDEDIKLKEKFRSLFPSDMLIAWEKNCPPVSVLHRYKHEFREKDVLL
jgi:putative glycosyltransferase (TIGR04372 family)